MRILLTLILLTVSLPSAAALAPISWRVEAGFAPFGYAKDPNALMQTWDKQIRQGNYATWAADPKRDPRLISPFAMLINGKDPWMAATGQYDRAYVHPTHTVIRASLAAEAGTCVWELDGKPAASAVPCNEDARINEVPLTGATLTARKMETGETVSETIAIDHRVILALGDSYASGEGNPDIPTQWKAGDVPSGQLRWLKTAVANDAQWWDNACHRSFWSNQTLVALKIAAADPHRLVTYLQYSCSGAEILDGMLTRQATPPGIAERCSGDGCYLKSSQLAAAVRDLCVGNVVRIERNDQMAVDIKKIVSTKPNNLYRADSYDWNGLDLVRCPSGLIQPDLVLLSIGGNDAGFSQLVAWAIAPNDWTLRMVGRLVKGNVVCPANYREKHGGCEQPFDIDLRKQLERRYALLTYAMRNVLPVSPASVVQSTYPDPMMQSDGGVCGDPFGLHTDGPWIGAASLISSPFALGKTGWHYNITRDADDGAPGEARALSTDTIPEMLKIMDTSIRTSGFVRADLHHAFIDHGWCNAPTSDPPLSLPSFARKSNTWRCGESNDSSGPSCWSAYAPSKRFIRTINDSLLTQSSRRRDGHTGSAHPNLGGHATIADIVFDTAAQAVPWIDSPQRVAELKP